MTCINQGEHIMPGPESAKKKKTSIIRGHEVEPSLKFEHVFVSYINYFNECKRKAYYMFVRNLEPRYANNAFFVGSAFHKGIQVFYDGFPPEEVLDMTDEWMDEYLGDTFIKPEEEPKIEKQRATVIGMLTAYMNHYGKRDKWEVIGTEQSMSVRLKELDVDMIGTIDLLYHNLRKDPEVPRIADHKSASAVSLSAGYFERLAIDLQVNMYPILSKLCLNLDIRTVNYNVVMKPTIRPRQAETYDEFLDRIIEEYVSDPKKYFFRKSIVIKSKNIDESFKDFVGCATDIASKYTTENTAYDKDNWPRNTKACFNSYGRCPYFNLCRFGMTRTELMNFTKREGTDRGHIIKAKSEKSIHSKGSKELSAIKGNSNSK